MHAIKAQATSLCVLDHDHSQRLSVIGRKAIPSVGSKSMTGYSLGSDQPWPDQGLNRILAAFDSFNTSDLNEIECLEMLFYLSSRRKDSRQIAEAAIAAYGSLGKVFERPGKELRDMLGLDHAMTAQLAIAKTSMKFVLANDIDARKELSSYAALMDYLALQMRHADQEILHVIYLDTKNKIIKDEEMARGTIDAVEIYPKEVAKRALAYCASSVILAHNHLADDPRPSQNDIEATLKTKGALECFDIVLHDHVIIAQKSCFSMKEKNLI